MTYSDGGWDFAGGGSGGDPGAPGGSLGAEPPAPSPTPPATRRLPADPFGPAQPDPYGPAQPDPYGPAQPGPASAGHSAPLGWLFAAAATAALSIGIGLLASFRPAFAVTGWLLAGFVTIGLVTLFTLADARRRADPWYLERSTGRWLRAGVLLAALLGVGLNAWWFADYVSRIQSF